jgi:predicted site-specific integrase-resolvase
MTAKQVAEKMGVNYRTALNWLDAGIVPGAKRKTSPFGEYWDVPEKALNMARPKPGPKAGRARKPQENAV